MKRYFWVLGVILMLGLIVFIYFQQSKPSDNCVKLSTNLDKNIVDTNNPPGRYIISGYSGIVGGVLTSVQSYGLGSSSGYYEYDLTFRGINSEGNLYLITQSNQELPYRVGQFYKFDLSNKSKYSAELSGSFIDENLDKLVPINC